MTYKGSEILLNCLKDSKVDTIFGYPGGAVIPLYDALFDYKDHFKHYRSAHEQGAVHAADGYARTTGKIGVCFATSGPGATNTITGIATAYMDSVPLLVITGQVPSILLGKDSFQEIDITGITFPITKHNYIVRRVEDLEGIVKEAMFVATSGRPGPVLIDIPKDIFNKTCDYKSVDEKEEQMMPKVADEDLTAALELIAQANKPVIYAGGGVILGNAVDQLRRFAKQLNIPVVNTLMGLGTYPREDDLSLGIVGMHGFSEANLAVSNADLIIAIGARFSDRVIGNPEKFAVASKVIHIDVDITEINKNIKVDISLLGDLNTTLEHLIVSMEPAENSAWLQTIESFKKETSRSGFVPKNILNRVNNSFKEGIVVTDVGQHQMWTAQYWQFNQPRTFVTSGGLGTMGFGLGAAIGAKVGNPDKPVVLVTGDGSFRMNCNELSAVSSYNIPLRIVLFNNQTLGMVRQWQKMFQEGKYSETCIQQDVDYVKLADAYGIKGIRVDTLEALDEALLEQEGYNEPVLIECVIDKDENVIPIVPPGRPINEFLLG